MTDYDRLKAQIEAVRLASSYREEIAEKRGFQNGKDEGRAEGKKEGKLELIEELLKDGFANLEKIAAMASLPLHQIKQIQRKTQHGR